MTLDRGQILAEIDGVLGRCGVEVAQPPNESAFDGRPDSWLAESSTACLALLDRLAGSSSSYRQAAQTKLDQKFPLAHSYTLAHLVGVLLAFRADVEAGYTLTLAELVHADLFADFMEMADELLAGGYRDAATVIAGSVLEEHLRKLGEKNDVDVQRADGSPKKADTLNADLGKVGVYNKLEEKSVVAWLDLRNKAAHGQYGEYDLAQVETLLRDVRSFMARHPA